MATVTETIEIGFSYLEHEGVKENLIKLLHTLNNDLNEVGFEPSEETEAAIQELVDIIDNADEEEADLDEELNGDEDLDLEDEEEIELDDEDVEVEVDDEDNDEDEDEGELEPEEENETAENEEDVEAPSNQT